MKVAIVNLGQIVSGDWRDPFAAGDAILIEGERIAAVGTAPAAAVEACRSEGFGLSVPICVRSKKSIIVREVTWKS